MAWGSPRAGPPMGKEGGVRCARSGIRMLPAHNVLRRTPCSLLIACRVSLCRRSSGHCMLHISHMQRQRVQAQLRMYCWCLLLARD